MKSLSLASLKRAIAALKSVCLVELSSRKTEFDRLLLRDSTIQRFEFTQELCFRIIKKTLEHQFTVKDVETIPYRDLIRMAHERGLISKPKPWFLARDARNKTSHAYDEKIANDVYKAARSFLPVAENLLEHLEPLYAAIK